MAKKPEKKVLPICKNPNCGQPFTPGHYGDRQLVCTGSYTEKCGKKCPGKTCKKCAGKGKYSATCKAWYRKYWSQTRKPPRGMADAERERALAAALKQSQRFWALLVVASSSALRKGELLGITWADVQNGSEIRSNFPLRGQWDDTVGFKETKTDSGRIAFLLKEAREALAKLRKGDGAKDKPVARIWTYTEVETWVMWTNLQNKLRISNPDTGRAFRFHDLRHTAALRALKKTGKLSDASTLCGHKNPATTAIYTQQRPEDFVASIEEK
jgi:integrase